MTITELNKLLVYKLNTAPHYMFHDVYLGEYGSDCYYSEKMQLMRLDWDRWAGSLDDEHQQRLVDAINNYTGARD